MGFVFYDTETTGTDTDFDQILQFAAIHTDFQFNELDRIEIRCRLMPHIVAAPGAVRVTKVTAAQLCDGTLDSHYAMMRKIREKLVSWAPAIFIGYNSLRFDEHLLRQAFYKTLHPVYLTNNNGNMRTDALRIVQAVSLFAPGVLTLPVNDDGDEVFKLDRVAPLNGFAHERAHDAAADVEATIFLCRMLAEKAPEVWSSFMRFSQKAAVVDYLSAERVFCLSDFYFGKPYSWIVTEIGRNAEIGSEHFVYNLAIDPDSLRDLSDDDLVARLARLPKPVRRLKSNGCPIIVPVDDAPAIARAAEFGFDELMHRADVLAGDDALRARLIAAFQSTQQEREPSIHVEQQLYDSFFSKPDEMLMEKFHVVPWEQRLGIIQQFGDPRLQQIGRRLIYIERPDLFPAQNRFELDCAAARRVCANKTDVPWLTLPQAIAAMDELLAETDPAENAFLQEHREHLSQRLQSALLVLAAAMPPNATVIIRDPSASVLSSGALLPGHQSPAPEIPTDRGP